MRCHQSLRRRARAVFAAVQLIQLFGLGTAIAAVTVNTDLSSQLPPLAHSGQQYDWTFLPSTFSSDSGASLTYDAQGLPDWAAFDTKTGAISGMPPKVSRNGERSRVTIRADDGSGPASSSFVFTTIAAPAPTLTESLTDQLPKAASMGYGNMLPNKVLHMPLGWSFSIGFQGNTFVLPEDDRVYYSSYLQGAEPLPDWLVFNESEMTYSGIAPTKAGPNGTQFDVVLVASNLPDTGGPTSTFSILLGQGFVTLNNTAAALPPVEVVAGQPFSYQVPNNLFLLDGYAQNEDDYTFQPAPGAPSWVSMDSNGNNLTGVAPFNASQSQLNNVTVPIQVSHPGALPTTTNLTVSVYPSPFTMATLPNVTVQSGKDFKISLDPYLRSQNVSVNVTMDSTLSRRSLHYADWAHHHLVRRAAPTWVQYDTGSNELKGSAPPSDQDVAVRMDASNPVANAPVPSISNGFQLLVRNTNAPNTTQPSAERRDKDGLSAGEKGAIAGSIVGAALLAALASLCCLWWRRRRRQRPTSAETLEKDPSNQATESIALEEPPIIADGAAKRMQTLEEHSSPAVPDKDNLAGIGTPKNAEASFPTSEGNQEGQNSAATAGVAGAGAAAGLRKKATLHRNNSQHAEQRPPAPAGPRAPTPSQYMADEPYKHYDHPPGSSGHYTGMPRSVTQTLPDIEPEWQRDDDHVIPTPFLSQSTWAPSVWPTAASFAQGSQGARDAGASQEAPASSAGDHYTTAHETLYMDGETEELEMPRSKHHKSVALITHVLPTAEDKRSSPLPTDADEQKRDPGLNFAAAQASESAQSRKTKRESTASSSSEVPPTATVREQKRESTASSSSEVPPSATKREQKRKSLAPQDTEATGAAGGAVEEAEQDRKAKVRKSVHIVEPVSTTRESPAVASSTASPDETDKNSPSPSMQMAANDFGEITAEDRAALPKAMPIANLRYETEAVAAYLPHSESLPRLSEVASEGRKPHIVTAADGLSDGVRPHIMSTEGSAPFLDEVHAAPAVTMDSFLEQSFTRTEPDIERDLGFARDIDVPSEPQMDDVKETPQPAAILDGLRDLPPHPEMDEAPRPAPILDGLRDPTPEREVPMDLGEPDEISDTMFEENIPAGANFYPIDEIEEDRIPTSFSESTKASWEDNLWYEEPIEMPTSQSRPLSRVYPSDNAIAHALRLPSSQSMRPIRSANVKRPHSAADIRATSPKLTSTGPFGGPRFGPSLRTKRSAPLLNRTRTQSDASSQPSRPTSAASSVQPSAGSRAASRASMLARERAPRLETPQFGALSPLLMDIQENEDFVLQMPELESPKLNMDIDAAQEADMSLEGLVRRNHAVLSPPVEQPTLAEDAPQLDPIATEVTQSPLIPGIREAPQLTLPLDGGLMSPVVSSEEPSLSTRPPMGGVRRHFKPKAPHSAPPRVPPPPSAQPMSKTASRQSEGRGIFDDADEPVFDPTQFDTLPQGTFVYQEGHRVAEPPTSASPEPSEDDDPLQLYQSTEGMASLMNSAAAKSPLLGNRPLPLERPTGVSVQGMPHTRSTASLQMTQARSVSFTLARPPRLQLASCRPGEAISLPLQTSQTSFPQHLAEALRTTSQTPEYVAELYAPSRPDLHKKWPAWLSWLAWYDDSQELAGRVPSDLSAKQRLPMQLPIHIMLKNGASILQESKDVTAPYSSSTAPLLVSRILLTILPAAKSE